MNSSRLLRAISLLWLASSVVTTPAASQEKHPITFADFAAVKAVADPQLSPDGTGILYTVRATDIDANRRTATTYLVRLPNGAPGAFPDDTTQATEARWSPDGKAIAYVARGQLWIYPIDGTRPRLLTRLSGGATGPVWSPLGDRVAFVSAAYPECADDPCNVAREHARDTSKVKAHVADQLMYRHWNAWDEGQRAHLFVVGVDGGGVRDLTAGARYDVPPGPFGGSEGYAFSPDGRELAYSAKDQGRADAWTTDVNLYVVPVAGGPATVITASNLGADQNPVYSPDGKHIAYASQARAGFESDRWRLMLYDRQARRSRELLPAWDRNADSYGFMPGAVWVATTDAGRDKLYRFPLGADGRAGKAALMIGDANNTAFTLSRDARTIAWLRDAAERPAEVYVASVTGAAVSGARQFTHLNDALIAQLALNPVEEMWYTGASGQKVQAFVMKPPQWQPGKKFPVVLLIHGGPQGAWLDNWHSRWNYQMFAAPGLGLVIANPRGSFGYGQQFVDQISRDWGGKVYTDLMSGLDAALARYAWMDRTRLGAAGGSYGGYMVNWIAGHSTRFKALVTHAGPFNLENMNGATEEQWFPEWEYGGPFWNSAAMTTQYRKFSPHLFAKHFKTPTLVTGGELDYRVPYTEDLSMFTALQRQNVPSRLVVFPDEGHWIAKPQNQRLWWSEVQGWLKKYLGVADTRASR